MATSSPMLKKLRLKFVAYNMAIVTVVLGAIMAGILAINHHQEVSAVDEALDAALQPYLSSSLSENFPSFGRYGSDTEGFTPPRIGNDRDAQFVTPIAVYRAELTGTSYLCMQETTSASLSDDVLESALKEVVSNLSTSTQDSSTVIKGASLSSLGLYYHAVATKQTIYVAFADASAINTWQTLLPILAIAGVGALALFLVISILFSRWALRPVEEAWTSQKQFVADASHELKTPLTVILANLSLMKKHPDNTVNDEAQWIDSTEQEAKLMQGLVGDLLELARLDEGAPTELLSETVNLSTIVEGTLLQFESIVWEAGITMHDDVAEGIMVTGSHKQLSRLVNTLVENANKYVNANGTITVSLKKEGSSALLRVTNTGPTIPAEDLPHVFDRFYRVDKARTQSDATGHGLGLAIAQKIAEAHQGAISVTSTEAAGTTFCVKLPLA